MTIIANKKSKTAAALVASFVALTMLGTTFSSTAEAGKRKNRYIAGGIIAGVVGGAIIANSARRHRGYDDDYDYDEAPRRSSRWERHVARCYRAYRSYNEGSDTYVGYDGIERRCRK